VFAPEYYRAGKGFIAGNDVSLFYIQDPDDGQGFRWFSALANAACDVRDELLRL
jgi:hypothetical protein